MNFAVDHTQHNPHHSGTRYGLKDPIASWVFPQSGKLLPWFVQNMLTQNLPLSWSQEISSKWREMDKQEAEQGYLVMYREIAFSS